MSVTQNIINNIVRVIDEATPKLQAIGEAAARLGRTVERAGDDGAKGINKIGEAARRVGPALESLARGQFATTAKLHEYLRRVEGMDTRKIAEFERRVRELYSMTPSKKMREQILSASSFDDLDRIGEKLLVLKTRMELFRRSVAATEKDPRAAILTNKILSSQSMADLEKVEARLIAIEQRAKNVTSKGGGLPANALAMAGAVGGAVGAIASAAVNGVVGMIEFAVNAIVGFFKSAHNYAMQFRDLLNVSKQTSLSLETLRTLDFAGKLAGIDIGTLQNGMEMLSQTIVTMPERFEAVGVSVRHAKGNFLTLEEILPQLADKINTVKDKTLQLYLVQELVGQRIGGRILPLLKLGSQGMDRFGKAAKDVGFIPTKEEQQKLIRYANIASVAMVGIEGAMNQLKLAALDLLPVLWLAAEGILVVAKGVTVALRIMLGPLIPLAAWLHKTRAESFGLSDSLADMSEALADASSPLTAITTRMQLFQESIASAKQLVDQFRQKSFDEAMVGRMGQRIAEEMRAADATSATGSSRLANVLFQIQSELGSGFTQRAVQAALDILGIGKKAEEAARKAKQFQESIAGLKSDLSSAVTPVPQKATTIATSMVADSKTLGPAQATARAMKAIGRDLELGKIVLAEVNRLMNEQARAAEEARDNVKKAADAAKEWAANLNDAANYTQLQKNIDAVAGSLQTLALQGTLTGDAIAEALKNSGLSAEQFAEAVARAKKKMEELGEAKKKLPQLQEYVTQQANFMTALEQAGGAAFSRLTDAAGDFFKSLIDKAFQSKDMFTQIFKVIAEEATRMFIKLAAAKLFLKLFGGPLGWLAGATTPAVGPMLPPNDSPTMARTPSGTTNNYITVQSFSPRDVVMEMTRPGGSLRAANRMLSYAAEY